MKKKILCMLLPLCLMFGTLASCNGPETPSSSETDLTESEEPSETSKKKYTVVDKVPEDTFLVNGKNCFTLTEESVFTDLKRTNESGHLGHAMVEYADGSLLAFYPRCNADNGGHSGRGWMEYKRSTDYGKTWSRPVVFEHSYNVFQESEGKRSVMCEKAERAEDGTIVLFLLNCDVEENAKWEPYFVPEVMLSHDGGETWEEPYELGFRAGRVYDSLVVDGEVYALLRADGGVYYIYKSSDNGKTFTEEGRLPKPLPESYYGTMSILPDGRFIVYVYNPNFEQDLEYFTSEDRGKKWQKISGVAHFEKKLRNPQLVCYNGSYFCFGRSGGDGSAGSGGHFVMYCSTDGINWDEGSYLKIQENGAGEYANTLVVGTLSEEEPNTLLVQASHAYSMNLTDVYMWRFEMEILK